RLREAASGAAGPGSAGTATRAPFIPVILRLCSPGGRRGMIENGVQSRPCVVVLTYARPDSLALLLDDLERECPPGGLDVHVYDDATPAPDPALEARIRRCGWQYRRAPIHHGKQGGWRWWNTILGGLRARAPALTYVLDDDL